MKMNATKLTIALVALLLALTCVFAACGKKNNTDTPDDTTPVDNTPVAVDTVAKEDLNAIAENLKAAYVANYVDLYAPATANEIEAAKSAALINIFAATSKEEAQKVADDFIAYLKSQKTIVDSIAALVEKIGDVSLKDADALNELTDVVATLDAAYAGTNTAKQAVLDAYKADAKTQKTIKDITDRYAQLKAAKVDADVKKGAIKADGTKADADGINVVIAELKADYAEEGKEFTIADFTTYENLLNAMKDFAKEYDLVADTDAYADVFDMVTLKAAKATLDAAFAKDPVLSKMQAVVDAWKVLEAAAEKAQWREYVYVDSTLLKPEKDTATSYTVEVKLADGTVMFAKAGATSQYALLSDKDVAGAPTTNFGSYTVPITFEDGATYYKVAGSTTTVPGTDFYATEKDAALAGVKKTTKIEVALMVDDGTAPVAFADYQLALKAAVETAVDVRDALLDDYPNPDSATSELKTKYGYGKTGDEPVKKAVDAITKVAKHYGYSVNRAYVLYGQSLNQTFMNTKTNVELDKDVTYGDYSLQVEFDKLGKKLGGQTKVNDNLDLIDSAIAAAIANITAQDEESGTTYTLNDYASTRGLYKTRTSKVFDLVNGVPTIHYEAWTYRWEIEKDNITNKKNKNLETSTAKFDALRTLVDSDNGADISKAALRWLAKYIGTEEYADSYDFSEYKKYNGGFDKKVLYMTDRDITEVAVPTVVSIRGNAVNVAKDDTDLGAKLLSPYTVAKALVAEEEKIVAAKKEAIEELTEAALALRTTGDASAIDKVENLRNDILYGYYVDSKLGYELDFDNYYAETTYITGDEAYINYLKVSLTGVKVVVQEKPEVKVDLVDMIGDPTVTPVPKTGDARDALDAAIAAFNAIEATRKGIDSEYVTFASLRAQQRAINGYQGLKDRIADNTAFATLFQNYVEQATAAVNVAIAGQNANVIKAPGTSGATDSYNDNEKVANEKLAQVQSLQNIFSNYGTFESTYYQKGYTFLGGLYNTLQLSLTATDFSNYVDGNFDGVATTSPADTGFLDTYWNKAAVTEKEHVALAYRLYKIVNASSVGTYTPSVTPASSTEDNVRLNAKLKTDEEKFTEDLAKYKLGVKASDALFNISSINAANAAITDFADNNIADYVNLKVAYKLGDDTVEIDYFTETYREIVMANSQNVITKVMVYAGAEPFVDADADGAYDVGETFTDVNNDGAWTAATATSLETLNGLGKAAISSKLDGDNWVNGVTSRVDKLAVKFDTVASKKAGDNLVKSYEFSDTTYSLEYALELINKVLTDNSKPAITLRDLRDAAYK